MKEKIKKLIIQYRTEVKILIDEKNNTSSHHNYYYLDGRIQTIKILINDLEQLI